MTLLDYFYGYGLGLGNWRVSVLSLADTLAIQGFDDGLDAWR